MPSSHSEFEHVVFLSRFDDRRVTCGCGKIKRMGASSRPIRIGRVLSFYQTSNEASSGNRTIYCSTISMGYCDSDNQRQRRKAYFLSAAAKTAMGESDAISMEEKISMGQTATAMMYCFENTVE